jgi:hypothetical protein
MTSDLTVLERVDGTFLWWLGEVAGDFKSIEQQGFVKR